MGDWAFGARTPTTWNGLFLIRTVRPTGSIPAPKSLSATVLPRTTTFVPESTSDGVKSAPEPIGQERMSKNSGVVPVTEVVQFWSSERIWDVARRLAAA